MSCNNMMLRSISRRKTVRFMKFELHQIFISLSRNIIIYCNVPVGKFTRRITNSVVVTDLNDKISIIIMLASVHLSSFYREFFTHQFPPYRGRWKNFEKLAWCIYTLVYKGCPTWDTTSFSEKYTVWFLRCWPPKLPL